MYSGFEKQQSKMEEEEIGRGGEKRKRDGQDSSEEEKTSKRKSPGRKRRLGSGGKIIWKKEDHEDQEEKGHGEVEIIVLDSSEERSAGSPFLGDSGARPSYPGSTISDNIKRLTFHHVLGRGTFGMVVLAENIDTRQKFAVKVIAKSDLLVEGEERAMVERHVLHLASGSPFLVHGQFAFQTKGLLLLGMEYMNCGDFHQLLQRKGPFDIASARFYAAELVCGIQHLHSKGIVHRDLKPSNILVTETGHIKIADFGLALENIYGDRTVSGYAGTPGFMAPEMLAEEEYNAGVDWYALGIILNIMITGKSKYHRGLFNASNMEAKNIIKKLLREDPAKRLGVNGNIRAHRFFQHVQWDSVQALRVPPPHTLSLPPNNIRRGFRPFNIERMEAAEAQRPIPANQQAIFTGFSFVNWKTLEHAPAL
ncbi:protein kinase C delta type-like [Engystomops pustulosus]|uniref:protein kinase C delta type-like n=1 Tax=Engystomops pustulosus TaxID=76066 RepID=UPI003AFAC143